MADEEFKQKVQADEELKQNVREDVKQDEDGQQNELNQGFGETEHPFGRSRRSRITPKASKTIHIRRIIIFSVLEVLVLFGIFAYAYAKKLTNEIQRPDFAVKNVENSELTAESLQKMKGYWNIAAFGVDARDSSLGKGNNSDVIMIVSINQETGEIRIVSVFRDTYLSLANGTYNKINQAYAVGGPELAVKALNQNLDLNITDYVTFNWKAVATGINILGGVDVDISKAEFYYINSYITETVKVTKIGSVQLEHAGMNHLDGVQAVAYARLRYMDNDYARTERQRKIIGLCYEKAKKADANTLSEPSFHGRDQHYLAGRNEYGSKYQQVPYGRDGRFPVCPG